VYGGAYYPELWAADADAALATLGEAVVLGLGLGAYVALLLAGGRPGQVRCAVLGPGAGLEGGGPALIRPPEGMPDVSAIARSNELLASPKTDETALAAQHLHVRPPDYARRFAERARRIVLLEDGTPRPPWWGAVREGGTAETVTGGRAALPAALARAREAATPAAPAR
jgi:pimeloyl-ACP methyl ester carboxylesterase